MLFGLPNVRHFALSLCLATVPACNSAESATPNVVVPAFNAIAGSYFALSVGDLAASTQWYIEKFGLSVKTQVPKANGVQVNILEGGGLIVELVKRDDAAPISQAAPGYTAERVYGVYKVGFVVDDLNATLGTLSSRGVQIVLGPFPASGTQRANVLVKDNGGNLIQLFGR